MGSDSKVGRHSPHVVVVGAGIAGLTAAYRLHQAGLRVTIFEKQNRVGGRMITDHIDGFVVDRGAQFLSTAYSVLPGLAREMGLVEMVPASPYVAFRESGQWRRLHSGRPWSPVSSGVLDLKSWLHLGSHLLRWRRAIAHLSLTDYGNWQGFEDQDALTWALQCLGARTAHGLLEPIHRGLYFQSLQATSRALALAQLAFGYHAPVTATMAGGIGVIPEAMARITPVTLISTVSSIRVRGDQLTIVTDRAEVDADFVVLATTAWVAARLNSGGSETEQALMATQYHATILLAIATSPGYRLPSALSDVYGVLFGRANPGRIAAIAFERNQSPDRVPAGKLLNVMLDSEAAREAMSWSDDATLAWVMPELEGRFPGISGQIAWAQVTRWPEAIPQSPVGRSGAIYRYRNQDHRQRRVFLAGDYLGFPWTDSAAATGIWAAEQIVAQHRSRAE